jgi:hypothetical protein
MSSDDENEEDERSTTIFFQDEFLHTLSEHDVQTTYLDTWKEMVREATLLVKRRLDSMKRFNKFYTSLIMTAIMEQVDVDNIPEKVQTRLISDPFMTISEKVVSKYFTYEICKQIDNIRLVILSTTDNEDEYLLVDDVDIISYTVRLSDMFSPQIFAYDDGHRDLFIPHRRAAGTLRRYVQALDVEREIDGEMEYSEYRKSELDNIMRNFQKRLKQVLAKYPDQKEFYAKWLKYKKKYILPNVWMDQDDDGFESDEELQEEKNGDLPTEKTDVRKIPLALRRRR